VIALLVDSASQSMAIMVVVTIIGGAWALKWAFELPPNKDGK
jgi:hypothetical protein